MSKVFIQRIENGAAYFEYNQKAMSCCPWTLSEQVNVLDELHCEQALLTLTTMEADATLIDWFRAIDVGGQIYLTLPDSDYYARLWLDANWDEKNLRDADSDARRAFTGLFGNQQGSNPKFDDYSVAYTHVNKSAYNIKRLRFLLERAGFVDVEVVSEYGVLSAKASKSMNVGERQISTNYDNIRLDHKNRYQFACDQLQGQKTEKILDLACGIGYGTLMLAKATQANVTGVDIDAGAVEYANNYYSNSDTHFICEDAQKCQFQSDSFDAIISFETIEHVPFDKELLIIFNRALKVGGRFICSTPNQDIMPYDPIKFRFHEKHYTNSELVELLTLSGFSDIQLYAQLDPKSGTVVKGEEGCFTIAVATK